MLSTVEVPESLEKRYESNKQLGHKIAEALEGTGEEKTLTADVDLLAGDEPVYVYVRGSAYFKFYHGGRLLRMYSMGDFVPAGSRFTGAQAKIICDFAADVIVHPAGERPKIWARDPTCWPIGFCTRRPSRPSCTGCARPTCRQSGSRISA